MTDIHDQLAATDAEQDDDMEMAVPDTAWPKVIGVISLLYASMGMMCITLITASAFLMGWLLALGGMGDIEVPIGIKLQAVVMGLLSIIVGIVMLGGSISLLRRRRSGVVWLKRWVILRMGLLVIGIVAAFAMAPMNIAFERQTTERSNEMLIEAGRPGSVKEIDDESIWKRILVRTTISTAVFAAYPIFLGLFLSRRAVTEEIEQWV